MNYFEDYTVFNNNREKYNEVLDNVVLHERGYFILAPSGSGKTHYINNQTENHWIDGDKLWVNCGAHPDCPWWTMGPDMIREVDARSDVVTQCAKRMGLWILGASNCWLKPDAIVLLPWDLHVKYIKYREENNYDGGLKSNQLEQLANWRTALEEQSRRDNIPVFESIEAAVSFIDNLYKKQ